MKAAEAQACNKVFLRMWPQKMDETNRVHIWVRVALQSSVTMDELLKANDSSWHVPSEAYRNLCDAANKYCICVVALENHFQRIEDRKLFQSGTFKQHWLLHAVQIEQVREPEAHLVLFWRIIYVHVQSSHAIVFERSWLITITAQVH